MSARSPSPSSSDYESADSTQDRPNKWQGNTKTWLNITASDRAIATSLTTLRDQDLSIHLYNAHALKSKAREQEEKEKNGENVAVNVLEDTGGFVPPKSWVAWPLRPEFVPREGGVVGNYGGEDGLGEGTLSRSGGIEAHSGEVLEDVLVGKALSFAKERFMQRMQLESDDSDQEVIEENQPESVQAEAFHVVAQQAGASNMEGVVHHSDKRGRKRTMTHDHVNMVPVVSTDDDRSRALLRPTVQHTLAKLDDMLLALHHARSTCLKVAEENSDSEEESKPVEDDPITPVKNPKGRPRKHAGETGPSATELLLTPRKSNRGRPKKDYPRLPGEADADYVVRVAKIRKVPLPAFAPPREVTARATGPDSPQPKNSTPINKQPEELVAHRRLRRLGLRDWSNVLGTAALVGFDGDVISRATQRCATMFGETMIFNVLLPEAVSEDRSSLQAVDQLVTPPTTDQGYPLDYRDMIQTDQVDSSRENSAPALDDPTDTMSMSDDTSDIQDVAHTTTTYACPIEGCPRSTDPFRDGYHLRRHAKEVHQIILPKAALPKIVKKVPRTVPNSLQCPVDGCKRSNRPFKNSFSLNRHLQRKHELSDDDESDVPQGSESGTLGEGMDGAVHVDGFLQPFDYPLRDFATERRKLRLRKMATRTQIIADGAEDGDMVSADAV